MGLFRRPWSSRIDRCSSSAHRGSSWWPSGSTFFERRTASVTRGTMPRLLITGRAGFLDSHLCERLIAEGWHVVCVDSLLTGSEDNLEHLMGHERFEYLSHDVTE